MNTPPEFCPETFSLAAEEEAHRVCRLYERALQGGHPLTLEALLSEIEPALRPLALYELVKIDAEFRQNQGDQPTSSDYQLQVDCPSAEIAVGSALEASLKTASQRLTEGGGNRATKSSQRGQDAPPDKSPRTIPKTLGRYSIAERLGRGGMGTVFKAFDSRLQRFVALKVPHFDKAGDVSIRERFRREALALAALHHDMIVAVHDVERAGDYEFMTMALIEGETLRRYLHEGRPLAEHQAAILVRALAKAMQYVHGSGVIHRDLKPENVIMEDGRKPVIVDFGLARSPGASELPASSVAADLGRHVTRFGQVAGTPEYSSPEQLAGDFDAVGPQTDVYSLGVMLFELLTGRLPWDAAEGAEASDRGGEVPRQLQACDLNPQVDRRLAAICAMAMNSKQADRYGSMAEFAEALKPFCQARPRREGESVTADKSSDDNIDAVLQEIARQAAPKFSRPTEQSVVSKRPAVAVAISIVLLALGSVAAAVIALRDREHELAESGNAASFVENTGSSLASPTPPLTPPPAPPDVAVANRAAAAPSGPPVNKAKADLTAPEPREIAAVPKSRAVEIPPPAWRSAAQQIVEAGGMIEFQVSTKSGQWHDKSVRKVAQIPDWRRSRIVGVVLDRPSAKRDYLTELRQVCAGFPATLKQLVLIGIALDEATISVITQLPNLEQLVLHDVGLSGPLCERLSGGSFALLRHIDLGGNQIDPAALDAVLSALERTAAPLESLGLAGAVAIGKQDLERIAAFPRLAELDLTDAAVGPAALVRLGDVDGLARLILAGVPLPNGNAKFLERLHHLEHVNLSRTDLSDDALTDLVRVAQNLSHLNSIDIRNTRFSSAGVLAVASRLGKRDISVTILAGDRLDFAYRTGPRRELALQHFQAGPQVEPAVAAGIDWLLRNQDDQGLWSLQGPYPNGAAEENQAEATALALLVLQGHGYDGLGKDQFHNAVRRGYRGLSLLAQHAPEATGLGPYGNALAALAVCDLHAMAGFRLQQNRSLPQRAVVDGVLARCRELQDNDGGWGEQDRGNALLTGWYVQALTSAEAAGFEVDPDLLIGAEMFLQKLWRADLKRFIYRSRDRRNFILGSHGSAVTSLQLIDKQPNPKAEGLFRDRHDKAAKDPYFCYYGSRAAVNSGGELWNLWNRNPLQEQLIVDQTTAGSERGSWFPSQVGDNKGRGCRRACGRLYATCLNLLALEAYYRHLPLTAPVELRTVDLPRASDST